MEKLSKLVEGNEDWLTNKILYYANKYNFVKYTSSLVSAWQKSIKGLSLSLLQGLQSGEQIKELSPDEDYNKNPIALFGSLQARGHRERGISLEMFLSLMKYYRQAYIDLILENSFEKRDIEKHLIAINRFFDRIEIGVCSEWTRADQVQVIDELQATNRFMINEKNRYLTIFESLPYPVIVLDNDYRIINLNQAAGLLFEGTGIPGAGYYGQDLVGEKIAWLAEDFAKFEASKEKQIVFEKEFKARNKINFFEVRLKRILDVSENFSGILAYLNEISQVKINERTLQRSLKDSERRQEEIWALYKSAGAVLKYPQFNQAARIIYDSCKELLGATSGYTALTNRDGNFNVLQFLDFDGYDIDSVIPMPICKLREEAFKRGNTIYENNFSKSKWAKFIPEGHVKLDNVLFAPLVINGRNLGIMGFANKPEGFTDYDAQMATTFAELTAIALFNKQTIELLKISEERFRAAFDDAAVGMAMLTPQGHFVKVNPAYIQLVGYSEEELKEMNFQDITHPDDLEDNVRFTNQLVAGEIGLFHMEKRYIHKLGHLVNVLLSVALVSDVNGSPLYIIGQIQDISKRKKMEQDLRDSEEKFRKLFNNASDAIFLSEFTNDGKLGPVIEANNMACQKLGYSREELLGMNLKEIDLPELTEELLTNGRISFEMVSTSKIGEKIPMEISSHIFTLNGAKVVLSIFRDISERKKMEEELLKASKIEAVGLLAGGIAHDFNNILTIIMGNVSLAQMQLSPDNKIYSKIVEIQEATLQAKDLTLQLLTFAKGGAPVKKTVSLNQMVKDAANFALSGSNVRCTIDIGKNLYPVDVDEGQFRQVLNNLLINADQAMLDGGEIQISMENFIIGSERTEPFVPLPIGNYVKISISDQGIGIPVEYQTKIFDPYFTTKQKGSGLGLATSYSVIKKHDGYITLESKPGKGTTFYIFLPASPKVTPSQKVSREKLLVGKGRILVMDDEEAIREITGEMLTNFGYSVELAQDGKEALELYQRARDLDKPFDLVIMDLTIPGGMGGQETMKRLLALDPNVKAIVSSGYSNDPVMAKYKQYGFKGCLAKPYQIQQLSKVIMQVFFPR